MAAEPKPSQLEINRPELTIIQGGLEQPPTSSLKGALIDVGVDRAQEITAALLRAHTAYKRGDMVGKYAALANAATTTLTSFTRALNASINHAVPELGKDPVTASGTRPARIVTSVASRYFPEVWGIPIQPTLDTFQTLANLASAGYRLEEFLRNCNNPNNKLKKINERDSWVRQFFSPVVDASARIVRNKVTDNADLVSGGGLVLFTAGAILQEKRNQNPNSKLPWYIPLGLEVAGYYCDALDGALARLVKGPVKKADSPYNEVLEALQEKRDGRTRALVLAGVSIAGAGLVFYANKKMK